jgi:hypothetical protein
MQYPNHQISARLFALAIATAMTMATLWGLASSAHAEATDVLGGADPAVESSAVSEQVPPPSAEAVPVNPPDASTDAGEANAVAEASPPATVPAVPAPSSMSTDSDAASNGLDSLARNEPVATAASEASKLAGTIQENATAAVGEMANSVAPVTDEVKSLEQVPSSAEHLLHEKGKTLGQAGTDLASPAEPPSKAVGSVHPVGLIVPSTGEGALAPAGVDTQSFSYHHVEGSLDSPLAEPEGIGVLPLWARAGRGDLVASGVVSSQAEIETASSSSSPGAGGEASKHSVFPRGIGLLQPPDSQAAASAPGGSSFVPIVALLALLALVAPAMLRRHWEMPASAAPIPFVCALERPG